MIPVIIPLPVILEIVLVDNTFPLPPLPPPKLTLIPVIALEPPVQLLNVLPEYVLFAVPPSVLIQPAIVVAPVTVIFEKLLLVWFITAPATELLLLVSNVIVPPALGLLKAVTIEFALIVCVPVAATK